MSNPELEKYINSAREQKVPDNEIKEQLVKVGWTESDVTSALSPKPSSSINLPPPPAPHPGMWVSFQYIIFFISLYVTATALSSILHYEVDDFIKDPVGNGYDRYSAFSIFDYFGLLFGDAILIHLATIIVAFPIFGTLFVVINKEAVTKPFIKGLKARKFLIYTTLVFTFLILIGHIIRIIYSFLTGAVTIRILANLAVTFLVTGSIFVYLLHEVWEDRKSQ